MRNSNYHFEDEQAGASMVEYVLLIALIFLVGIAAVKYFGERRNEKFEEIASAISEHA
ncbi:MAG: hypothetical protein KDD42_10325 [Bdellovibrionales bacterium]|nr:hypothetical protein [Bdellovibrionales bacterium]